MKVKIKFLPEFAQDREVLMPKRATPGSAAFDLVAAVGLVILPNTVGKVRSGFCMEIEEGYEVQVRPRSGLALKHRVTLINAPGTIDSDYRGEMCAMLINHGAEPFVVHKGDRVAQMVVAELPAVSFVEVDRLSETARGEGGFGSTGVAAKCPNCPKCGKPYKGHDRDALTGSLVCEGRSEFHKHQRSS